MDECHFDEATGRATEGLVVDADEDLAELCSRIRESQLTNCSIMFADVDSAASASRSVTH
jgi:hypothetical protein